MKLKIIITPDVGYIPAADGEIVEGIVNHRGDYAAFYDKNDSLFTMGNRNFQIIPDEAAPAPPPQTAGLPQIFGQELKRLEVEFK